MSHKRDRRGYRNGELRRGSGDGVGAVHPQRRGDGRADSFPRGADDESNSRDSTATPRQIVQALRDDKVSSSAAAHINLRQVRAD